MATKTINCSLSTIGAAIAQVEALQRRYDKQARLFAEKLATIGATVASIRFSRGAATYDGNGSVVVSVEPTDNGYKVVATGQAVAFIEFGSGAKYGGGYPLNTMQPQVDTSPGSWSTDPTVGKGHYADPKGWYYEHGKKSWGNPPAMAMYHASREMRDRVKEIAQEVFGQ